MDIYQTVLSWQRVINESMSPQVTLDPPKQEILISEPVERVLRPFVIAEMVEVIDEAVEAYRRATAAMRGSRSKIKKLYQTNNHQKVRYIGPSADQILEEYLTRHGLNTCSAMWSDLSRIVIDKAENDIFNKEDLVFRCSANKLPFVV